MRSLQHLASLKKPQTCKSERKRLTMDQPKRRTKVKRQVQDHKLKDTKLSNREISQNIETTQPICFSTSSFYPEVLRGIIQTPCQFLFPNPPLPQPRRPQVKSRICMPHEEQWCLGRTHIHWRNLRLSYTCPFELLSYLNKNNMCTLCTLLIVWNKEIFATYGRNTIRSML